MAERETHRDACRRQHRVIANYVALEAWLRGLDCVVLDRRDLQRLLGLERFKSARVAWMLTDFQPWFPYHVAYYRTASGLSSIGSLFLSRVPIEGHLPVGSMSDERRIERMDPDSPRTAILWKGATSAPSEAKIVSKLALYAAGLDAPSERRRRS